MTATTHRIQARKVAFDLSGSPLHWLPEDIYSSHVINGLHLLLPAGELWFCRIYNKALPWVADERLREDVRGFIRQEGVHAQARRHGEAWLRAHGHDVEAVRERVDRLFGTILGDAPFGIDWLKGERFAHQWLVIRVGLIAAVEHFTGLLGDWALNSKAWDKGDPVVADLFRWHLAEEVEHRTVAFELYEHLCRTRSGFYLGRQALMALVFPLFLYFVMESARALAGQDSDPEAKRMARRSLLRLVAELEVTGRRSDNVPTFLFMLRRTLRWVAPGFHPVTEGDTRQALDYIARSPAAQAGAA